MTTFADSIQSLIIGQSATVSAPDGIDGWTFFGSAGSSSYMSASIVDIGSGVRVIRQTDTGWGGNQCITLDALGDVANNTDVEILVKWRALNLSVANWADHLHICPAIIRANNTATAWYSVGPTNPTTPTVPDMRGIYFQSGGEWSGLGSAKDVAAFAANSWWWTRFKVAGNEWFWRVWQDGGSEPGTWDAQNVAESTRLGGYVGAGGVSFYYSGGFDVGYFSAATGTDSAPSPGGGGAPVISDIDTDEIVTSAQANVIVTGLNLTGATFDLVDGSITSALNVDSTSATSAQIDIALGQCRYGARVLRATVGAQSATLPLSVTAPTGVAFVDLWALNLTASNRITAVPDLAAGYQLEISNVIGGTINDVIVYSDGTFWAADAVTAFDVRAHDGTSWGSIGTQTVTGPDIVAPTISNLNIVNVTGASFDAQFTSNESGTAALLVTSIGAAQPSNAAFDASTETAAVTANVQATIHHTG